MFYFTTSIQMKHFQCVIHKPECSIQTQVVILKVLMIKSSAVTEPRQRDKNRTRSFVHLLKDAVNTLFFRCFHYVHLTTCVRLEEIINHQNFHLSLTPIQPFCLFNNSVPTIFSANIIRSFILQPLYFFIFIAGILQFFF